MMMMMMMMMMQHIELKYFICIYPHVTPHNCLQLPAVYD